LFTFGRTAPDLEPSAAAVRQAKPDHACGDVPANDAAQKWFEIDTSGTRIVLLADGAE
jgi:hypothetical protein